MTSLEGMSHIHIGPEINCGDVEHLNVSCFDCSKKINSSKFFAIFFMSAILTGVAITGETFYTCQRSIPVSPNVACQLVSQLVS